MVILGFLEVGSPEVARRNAHLIVYRVIILRHIEFFVDCDRVL